MLDAQGRVTIRKEVLSRDETIKLDAEVKIFYNPIKKNIILSGMDCEDAEEFYFIAMYKIDKKGRVFIPMSIRNMFPGATYLPAERNGRIYILIIEHEKKSE